MLNTVIINYKKFFNLTCIFKHYILVNFIRFYKYDLNNESIYDFQ